MLEEMLAERKLPQLKSREEMTEILLREEYGYMPETPYSVTVGEPKRIEGRFNNGNCCLSTAEMTVTTEYGSHTFPVNRLLHTDGKKRPFIVFMDFFPNVPSIYYPIELITEQDVDILSFNYQAVASDDDDFTNGLAKILMPEGRNLDTSCGKIMLWAFAAMRVLDYAGTLDELDMNNCGVLGHSRLGKTALVTGMLDTRFKFVFSNNAGCAGDSLAKGGLGQLQKEGKWGKKGEAISDICRNFPYWFCKNYQNHTEKNYSDEFDQHYLLAAIAPRYVYVSASDKDDWADPVSEQLCCFAAGKMWEEKYNMTGLIHKDKIVDVGECLPEGHVGFFRREGCHFLSYHNWLKYINFIKQHLND